MEIRFRDKNLRLLCEQAALAQAQLGMTCAKRLKIRLGELRAARVATDLVSGNPHILKGKRSGQLSLTLAGGARLVLSPIGSSDWSQVKAVCIEFIGDYHE